MLRSEAMMHFIQNDWSTYWETAAVDIMSHLGYHGPCFSLHHRCNNVLCPFSRPYLVRSRLCYSVASVADCLSSVRNVLWPIGASWSKSYYWQPIGSRIWEIDWYHNEWPWPLFRGGIKVMSHSPLNFPETVRDSGWVTKDHQYKLACGVSNGHATDDVTWPVKG